MTLKREFSPSANDHEAVSSRRAVPAAFDMGPSLAIRDRVYVTVVVAQIFCEAGAPMPWGAMHLPHGWHLSPDRVLVPPIPATSRARLTEIHRRHVQPADLREDPAYNDTSPYWDLWFEVEHDVRRRTYFISARRCIRTAMGDPGRRRPDPAAQRRRGGRLGLRF
jgi:hypothetical protein